MDSYSQQHMAYGSTLLGPELARFTGGRMAGFMEQNLPQKIAAQLRREVGLDLPHIRSALTQHLDARLNEIGDGLTFIEDNLGVPSSCPRPRQQELRSPDRGTGTVHSRPESCAAVAPGLAGDWTGVGR
ncbi:hypothetical protein [Streptomyces sp. IB2014 016-6]|uniref:hypothetical protein n=1 Tax=Streptomyces sp. IB2014 016-6 TaxID=2517818 RepID=UPI00164F548A|nr:hypothetical protein [Streptomyces sp. IB2014 016-6]